MDKLVLSFCLVIIFSFPYIIHAKSNRIITELCASKEICSPSSFGEAQSIKSTNICSSCLTITRYIEDKVSDYQTEEEIAEFIRDDVCGKLPNPVLKETCQSFMVEYGDSFVYKITMKIFDPDLVCSKELKLCPSKITINSQGEKSSELRVVDKVSSSVCDLCTDLVSKMETLIASPISHVNLTNNEAMRQVCSQFASRKAIEKCQNIYNAFGSHFITMIGFDVPRKICSSVDLCYNNNPHLLGGQKCTFGPTYWCHSIDHANACKATKFCKKNVWKPSEGNDTSSIPLPQCVLCHLFLKVINKELGKNKTVEQIEAALDTLCKKVYKDPTRLEHCQTRVTKYTKRFIELINQGVSSEVICIIFGLCLAGQDYSISLVDRQFHTFFTDPFN